MDVNALVEVLEMTLNLSNIDKHDVILIKNEAKLRGIEIYVD